MKAHTRLPRSVQDEIDRQDRERHDKIFIEAAEELCVQNLSTVFWTMHTRFGWGKKRLRQLADALHDTKDMMSNPSRLHHRFGPLECEAQIKEDFGIDLRAEFHAEVEMKP